MSRRQFLKIASILSGLLLTEGCQPTLPSLRLKSWCDEKPTDYQGLSPCDKIRPRQIDLLAPAENIVVGPLDHQVPITQGYYLYVSFSGEDQDLDPSSVRLFFDGLDVTEQSSRVFRGCYVPEIASGFTSHTICGKVQYEIRGPLRVGKHIAMVRFKDKQGQSFCYDWAFYADSGDGSGLRDLGPCDQIVPRQMGIVSPAHNESISQDEDVWIDVHFNVENIRFPESVRLFVDSEELTRIINWGPPPLRGHTFVIHRIPAKELTTGKHIVRIEFQDKSGQSTHYDWNFYIQLAH